jgi:hypothetical protein
MRCSRLLGPHSATMTSRRHGPRGERWPWRRPSPTHWSRPSQSFLLYTGFHDLAVRASNSGLTLGAESIRTRVHACSPARPPLSSQRQRCLRQASGSVRVLKHAVSRLHSWSSAPAPLSPAGLELDPGWCLCPVFLQDRYYCLAESLHQPDTPAMVRGTGPQVGRLGQGPRKESADAVQPARTLPALPRRSVSSTL